MQVFDRYMSSLVLAAPAPLSMGFARATRKYSSHILRNATMTLFNLTMACRCTSFLISIRTFSIPSFCNFGNNCMKEISNLRQIKINTARSISAALHNILLYCCACALKSSPDVQKDSPRQSRYKFSCEGLRNNTLRKCMASLPRTACESNLSRMSTVSRVLSCCAAQTSEASTLPCASWPVVPCQTYHLPPPPHRPQTTSWVAWHPARFHSYLQEVKPS